MQISPLVIVFILSTLCLLASCSSQTPAASPDQVASRSTKIGASLNEKVALAASDIPTQALTQIKELHPNFTVSEAEKEFKHGNTYLDIEGEVDDREIEFDMLQTETGWQIVEVQRDLSWDQLPESVATALKNDAPSFEPKRIIESVQFGTEITIFEFYSVSSTGKESRKEVKLEKGVASVLQSEWKH